MSLQGRWRIVEMPGYEADYPDMVEDEMDEACGDGWAELQTDGSLVGEINFHNGDEIPFIARPWPTSSTAC